MKPYYHLATQIGTEKAFYRNFPFWKNWIQRQTTPDFDVVQAIMGYATEPFEMAERRGALKVVDCQNSHPTSYFGYWQRECDLWCAGETVPIPRWMFGRMNNELVRADLVLCPSLFVKDTMVQNGIPEHKCFVNPFGVNTAIFKPRTNLPKHPRFISVGTICLRKGHQYLFRAFEKVRKSLPDAELICVGDYKRDFRFEKPKWEGIFSHHPALEPSKLADLLRSCTAFVFPSQEEGFARVIPEAMASALPVIATHESGATTLIEDGKQGYIIAAHDTDQLAQRMVSLAQNPAACIQMGNENHRLGAVSNTWQDYGDRLLDAYEGAKMKL